MDRPGDAAGAGAPFRLKALPIAITVAMGIGIPVVAEIVVDVVQHFAHLPERPQMPWIALYYHHLVQMVLALAAIYWFRKRQPGSYGLQLPQGKSYIGAAILWGLFFGVLMTLVDYGPQLLSLRPPADAALSADRIQHRGLVPFEGIFVGPSEETLFRGLLVTYLASAMPGTVSWRGYTMNGAGVVVALLFALAHFGSFFVEPVAMALGQQLYAFALGVLYAYWFEKSRSLVAPIIGHNVSDLTEYALIFAMVAAFR